MTAVKNHSMALKDSAKIEIEILNPTGSTSGWVCRVALSLKGGQSLVVYLQVKKQRNLASSYSEPLLRFER